MKRTTQIVFAITLALISAFVLAQTSPSQPAPQQTQTPSPDAQSSQGQATSPSAQPAPEQAQPAPPAQTTQPSQTPPAQTTAQPGQMQPVQGQSLSSPSLQASPLPQGCTQRSDKDRVRMKESCGVVVDTGGKPVPNAPLELVESGQQNAYLFVFSRTISDKDGKFDFGPVPSGHYLLRTPASATVTVYNFVALDTQNADGQCKKPVEVKAAAAGSCNSEVHSSGRSGFSLGSMIHRNKTESKADQPKN